MGVLFDAPLKWLHLGGGARTAVPLKQFVSVVGHAGNVLGQGQAGNMSDSFQEIVTWLARLAAARRQDVVGDVMHTLDAGDLGQKEDKAASRAWRNDSQLASVSAGRPEEGALGINGTWQQLCVRLIQGSLVAQEASDIAAALGQGRALGLDERWRLLSLLCDEACASPLVREAFAAITAIEDRVMRERRLLLRRQREALGERQLRVGSVVETNQGSWGDVKGVYWRGTIMAIGNGSARVQVRLPRRVQGNTTAVPPPVKAPGRGATVSRDSLGVQKAGSNDSHSDASKAAGQPAGQGTGKDKDWVKRADKGMDLGSGSVVTAVVLLHPYGNNVHAQIHKRVHWMGMYL